MMSSAGSAVMSSAGSAVMSSAGSAVMSSAGFAVRSAGIAIGPASDASSSDKAEAAATAGFPYVRRLGRIALIGVSSARPTAPFLATGRLGAAQRARLEELLAELGEAGLCRVLLMHHPPLPAGQSRRRQLEDAAELQALLARSGAELVLHGHTHRSHFATLPGPRQPIPVVGVPSSSAIGRRAGRRARYHIYRIVPRGGASASAGFALSFCARAFDPLRGCFVAEEERSL
jgi:3',5'-cyclic AMP phosphodiesterase CpdA